MFSPDAVYSMEKRKLESIVLDLIRRKCVSVHSRLASEKQLLSLGLAHFFRVDIVVIIATTQVL